jgi:hypothetical protein
VTDILPGQLIYIFGVSILDAALVSWLALLWYRRSVRRLMREGSAGTTAPQVEHSPPPVRRPATAAAAPDGLSLAEEQAGTAPPTPLGGPRLGRVVLAYSLGAGAYAAVITTLKFSRESAPLPAVAWLVDWWANIWPIVPTLAALLVLDRRRTVRMVLLYVAGGAFGIALFTAVGQILRGTLNSAPLTNVFWAMVSLGWIAAVPLALIALTGWRRVRAVMPLALAGTLLFGFALLLFLKLFIRLFEVGAVRSLILGLPNLASAATVYYLLFMLLSLPVGWVAWRLLIGLASAFSRKRFSEVQLVIDCWWAVVTAHEMAMTLSLTYGLAGIAAGLGAFAAYRLTVFAVLRGARPPAASPRRLLLLRVFGYQARTESLFDRVAQAWRFHGPVQLIAGVDLAMRTVDPGDVLALLDGRLAELYVRAPQEVVERLARLDLDPDPDGRFRINEVYCRDNTWQPMLEALLDTSDAVLMDLRSFSAINAGCIFELEQLVRRLPSDHIVLVCDKTTDLPLLQQILGDAWTAARDSGHTRGAGKLSVVRVERNSWAELGLLMQCLLRTPRRAALTGS